MLQNGYNWVSEIKIKKCDFVEVWGLKCLMRATDSQTQTVNIPQHLVASTAPWFTFQVVDSRARTDADGGVAAAGEEAARGVPKPDTRGSSPSHQDAHGVEQPVDEQDDGDDAVSCCILFDSTKLIHVSNQFFHAKISAPRAFLK
ncbi:hypothetical protein NQ317_012193 [Molorchus minor]|uniref:Uncharacterized protein n=1 Tax=Molorchus minor TaxID=1323400 RepID=A0ABQ9K4E7_9CUCU|nr:hypothetical protein NQ317_012193 [Molorchus minor]